MNTNQYTQKTLEALQAAQQLAVEYQHNQLEPEHLLHLSLIHIYVAAMGFGVAYIEALVCAIGAGCGFMLAMVMFSGVRKRVEACDPPAPFKGLPITLVAAAITSPVSYTHLAMPCS